MTSFAGERCRSCPGIACGHHPEASQQWSRGDHLWLHGNRVAGGGRRQPGATVRHGEDPCGGSGGAGAGGSEALSPLGVQMFGSWAEESERGRRFNLVASCTDLG
jgi:hypothetical protein